MNKNLKKYIELTDTINKFEKDKIPLLESSKSELISLIVKSNFFSQYAI